MSDALWNRSLAVLEACREPACLFEFLESVWHLDNVTHVEDLKKEAINALHVRGAQLHENLTSEASLEYIPDLRTFYDTWARLQTFIDLAGKSSIRSQLDPLVDKMKRADDLAKSKMNLAARIDRMLVVATSLDESGNVPKEDLKTIILTLRQARQQRQDHPGVSQAYHDWTVHLCAGLQSFASELEARHNAGIFVYGVVVDHLKKHLEECPLKNAYVSLPKSLQNRSVLHDVRKALDKENLWFSWIPGGISDSSVLLRKVVAYFDLSLADRVFQTADPNFDIVEAFESFEPLRRGHLMWGRW